jgi:hypothetical protein
MTRQVTDQLYIDLDYFTPEEYYVYVAEADSTPIVEATLSCDVGKIVESESDLTASFSQASTISHIHGADLFAMSEAELAALAERFRDNDINVDGVFDIGVDYIRVIQGLISADSTSDIVTIIDRIVNAASSLEAAFSIFTTEEKIVSGSVDLVSATSMQIDAEVFIGGESNITSEFGFNAEGGLLQDAEIVKESTFSKLTIVFKVGSVLLDLENVTNLEVDAVGVFTAEASLDSEFTSTIISDVFITAEAHLTDSFVSNIDVKITASLTADLFAEFTSTTTSTILLDFEIQSNSNFNFVVDVEKVIAADADLNSNFTQVTQEDLFKDFQVQLSSETASTLDAEKITVVDVDIVSESSVFCIISHIQGADIVAENFASLDVVVGKITSYSADFDSEFIIDAVGVAFVSAESQLTSQFVQTTQEDLFKDFQSNADSEFTQVVSGQVTADSTATLDSESSVFCIISHIQGADIVAEGFATLTADLVIGTVGSADITSNAEISVAFDRIRDHDSSQTSEASVFAEILRIQDFSSDLTAVAEQNADVNATLTADISTDADTALFCIISHIQGADLLAFSDASLDIDAVVLRGFDVDINAVSNSNIEAMVRVGLSGNLVASSNLDIQVNAIFNSVTSATGEFNLNVLGGLTQVASAALVANGGLLTLGRLVNLDMKVYVIPAETREYIIAVETRQHRIAAETRIHSIRSTK